MGGDLFSYFMMSAVFTGPIPLIFLCRRRKTLVRCRELMQSAANQATSTDCVAPLLDLLATPGLERSTFGRLAVLTRLLARLTTEEARGLTAKQCATLASVIRSRLADPELVIAGLLVLAEAQEPCLVDFARKLSQSQKKERLREAATEYLKAVQGE